MSPRPYRTTPQQIDHMPPGIPYIIGNEAAERFSFYGMKAVLVVFMTQHLTNAAGEVDPMSPEQAKVWLHTFTSAVYFFPILGAILSDWLFGKYPTILFVSLLYCVGHGILALMDLPLGIEPRNLLWAGLACIAVGAGGIKPCVSAHVGDQFGQRNAHLVSRVFGWFYFSINLGAAASTILTPVLLKKYGPHWAFGVPGVVMALATFVFWLGRKHFVHVPPAGMAFFKEIVSREGLRAVLNLVPLYCFVAMFWALFDQTASAWVLQAKHMNRWISLNGESYELLASQIQAANPILIMLLIPVFSYVVYPALGQVFEVTPLRKVGIGLFVAVLAFALSAWIEQRISSGETPHIYWQGAAYVLLTAAEVLVSITVLEFSYTQAPREMKSVVMGLNMLSVSLGNIFTAQVNAYIERQKLAGTTVLAGADYYKFFAIAMLVTAVLYIFYARLYRGRTYLQG